MQGQGSISGVYGLWVPPPHDAAAPSAETGFFCEGGCRFPVAPPDFLGFAPGPVPAPAPGPRSPTPALSRSTSGNQSRPAPSRPRSPPAWGEGDSPGLTPAPVLWSCNVRPCRVLSFALRLWCCRCWGELTVRAVPGARWAMQKKCAPIHCGTKKNYYLRETKDNPIHPNP